jgi:hypothetical protein
MKDLAVMIKNTLSLSLLVVLSLLTGCFGEEPVYDVEYYLQNDEERDKKIEYCEKSLDRQMNEVNCLNADEARQTKLRNEFMGRE